MHARYVAEQLSPDSGAQAIEGYRQAIEADPAFASAYTGLATALFNKGMRTVDYRNMIAQRPEIERLYKRAIALDPWQAAPHSGLGMLMLQFDWNWKGAAREFQIASAPSPNANAEMWLGVMLAYQRRFAESEPHVILAQELDPLGMAQTMNSALLRVQEGRMAEGRRYFEAMVLQNPGAVAPQFGVATAKMSAGEYEQALREYRELETRFPQAVMGEAMARARMGQREEALRLMRPFEDNYEKNSVPIYWYAMVYGYLNDAPNAVKWLGRSADRREEMVLNVGINLPFAKMQNDPGFRAFKRRIGLEQ